MNKIIVLLTCFMLFSSFKASDHKYYLSVTEIEYKSDKQALQIISRVFIDDFEEVLQKRYNKEIKLIAKNEEGNVRQAIERYLAKKLHIKTDGKELQLNYLGKEYENDQLVLYIEVEKVAAFKEIEVENLILTDLFDDQQNVVHVKVEEELKSMLLDRDAPMERLNY
ncbi:DUF6702 family protein [Salegentibacter chungangensis]|uniref:DUF6702 family protein n=1 Tax=Salegentibacter chungangensis TaxID=1335724 RepID=A0ABW3NW16_9FLAO